MSMRVNIARLKLFLAACAVAVPSTAEPLDVTFKRPEISVADKMTFPMGALWHDGALNVVSPPNVWRPEDTDRDGVADRREAIVTGLGWHGRSSSFKGPFLEPDGRFYVAGGSVGYHLKSPNGKKRVDSGWRRVPGVFSFRPDGSDLEAFSYGAFGADELAFSPRGEVFGVNTLIHSTRGDGMTHCVYGGIYPTTAEHPVGVARTGDLLPVMNPWGRRLRRDVVPIKAINLEANIVKVSLAPTLIPTTSSIRG